MASLWFAVATVSTLISGRLTFALGVAVGLAAVLAAARGRTGWACVLAALASLASPVAGAFVALAAAAWWLERPRWWPAALAACAVAPAAALAIAFPEGGSFPFVASSFWPALAAAIAVGLVIPREARVVRIGVALYALAIVASFVLATPMGGNVVRLGALFAGPVLAALVWRTNRRALALLALPLMYWQWVAPIDDWARAAGDPSVHERYYDGLLGFLGAQRGGPFRIEIPFTDNHWESRWVAPHVPLARGWERQVDRQRNALFYDDRPITAARYRRWLDDNAVRFVALADAPIDYSAAREAALVRAGTAVPARGLARRALARLRGRRRPAAGQRRGARDRDRARARAPDGEPSRARSTCACASRRTGGSRPGTAASAQGPGGWTQLRLERPGPVVVETSFALGSCARDRAAMYGLRAEKRPRRRTTSGSQVPVRCG